MNTINKTRTSNQVIRCNSLFSTQSIKFPSRLSLLRFLALSTNMTLLSTIIQSQIITPTFSSSVTWLPTIESIHSCVIAFKNMMSKLTRFETSHKSRSFSPTSLFPIYSLLISLLFPFISWSTIWFPTTLILFFLLTKTFIVSRSVSTILIIYYALIHQHRKSVNLLIPNTFLDLGSQATL